MMVWFRVLMLATLGVLAALALGCEAPEPVAQELDWDEWIWHDALEA